MALEANSGGRYEPKPIQTGITKEMLQEYQDEQNKPIIGKDGKLYKYHPETLKIELIKPDHSKIKPVLSNGQIRDYEHDIIIIGDK